jgi:hypothetical protein
MIILPKAPVEHIEIAPDPEEEKLEQLCIDFDTDCVLGDSPPFGSYSKCWDYDRSTGFCPFCLPRE